MSNKKGVTSWLTSKLAGDRPPRGLLFPQETQDSGIDSDNEPPRQRLDGPRLHSAESSSSDEELVAKAPWVRACKKKREDPLRNMPEFALPESVPLNQWEFPDPLPADRGSPPLYEVELTASEEDDDESVLEIVIAAPASRYQRVPTSSPKKVRVKKKTLMCRMFCCYRSRN